MPSPLSSPLPSPLTFPFADLDTAVVVAAVCAVFAAVVACLAGVEVVGRRRHRRRMVGACWVTVLAPPEVDPDGAAMFWRSLLGLVLPGRWRARFAGTAHVVFEYRFTRAGIELSVWVPGTVSAPLVASAIRAAWPGAHTHITPADTSSDPQLEHPRPAEREQVAGGRLQLARTAAFPLADDPPGDPVRGLLAAPGRLGPDQWARVQVLARPVSAARMARAARTTSRSGGVRRPAESLLDGVSGLLFGLVALVAEIITELIAALVPGSGSPARSHSTGAGSRPVTIHIDPGPQRVMDRASDRAVAGKLGGAVGGFVVAVRYAAATPVHRPGNQNTRGRDACDEPIGESTDGDARSQARARSRQKAHAVASSFAAFGGHNHFRRRRLWHPAAVLRARRLRRGDLLSIPELGALARLPVGEHVPGLRRAGAAAVAPPPQVPTGGPGVRPLGVSDAVAGRPVGLTVPDARHHVWIVGATGVGKSTLLVHGVLADAAAGRAAVVLDPKGDLVADILARLPAAARARTVVIDPDRPLRGPGGPVWPCLNPLAPLRGTSGHADAVGDVVAENVVTIFSRVFSSAWGFRSEDLLRVACLTVRAGRETPSLDMLPPLLSNAEARAHAVSELPRTSAHAALREFWGWYDHLSDPARAQIAAPLLNKLRAVLLRPFAARVLCGQSTVDLTRVLDGGGLLLVRMPKGPLGEDTVRLLGSLIVAQVWQTATARAAQPEHQRRDASLVLDECHNFLHLPYAIEDMLAEARGYRLGLTLSHQYIGQLPAELRDGIATDARSKIMFTAAPEDATRLAKHTAPELGPHDLAHLDAFHAAARLLCHGGETRAFTFVTRPLPPPEPHGQPNPPGRPLDRRSGPPTLPLPRIPHPSARPEQEIHDARDQPLRTAAPTPGSLPSRRPAPRPRPYPSGPGRVRDRQHGDQPGGRPGDRAGSRTADRRDRTDPR